MNIEYKYLDGVNRLQITIETKQQLPAEFRDQLKELIRSYEEPSILELMSRHTDLKELYFILMAMEDGLSVLKKRHTDSNREEKMKALKNSIKEKTEEFRKLKAKYIKV